MHGMAWHLWTAAVATVLCVGWPQGCDARGGPPAESAVTVDGAPPAGKFPHRGCVPTGPAHFALLVTGALSVEGAGGCPDGAPMRVPVCQLDSHLECQPTNGRFVGQSFSAGPNGVTDARGVLHAWAQGVDAAGLLQRVRDATAHRCVNLARVLAGKGNGVTWARSASSTLEAAHCEAWVRDRCAASGANSVVLPTGEDITSLCRG